MAVQLMVGGYKGTTSFAANMEENAVREAAAAGLQSVEKLIQLLSQTQHQDSPVNLTSSSDSGDYKAVADVAVNKFKKVISLLDRNRTGHARFRRGPLGSSPSSQPPAPPQPHPLPEAQQSPNPAPVLESKPHRSAFTRVYSSSHLSQRLPPLPSSGNHHHHASAAGVPKTVAIERKESSTTINFAAAPSMSAATSYIL